MGKFKSSWKQRKIQQKCKNNWLNKKEILQLTLEATTNNFTFKGILVKLNFQTVLKREHNTIAFNNCIYNKDYKIIMIEMMNDEDLDNFYKVVQ